MYTEPTREHVFFEILTTCFRMCLYIFSDDSPYQFSLHFGIDVGIYFALIFVLLLEFLGIKESLACNKDKYGKCHETRRSEDVRPGWWPGVVPP